MRRSIRCIATALVLVVTACDGGRSASTTGAGSSAPSSTVVTSTSSSSTTAVTSSSSTTVVPPENVEVVALSDSVDLWVYPDEQTSAGWLDGEFAFTLTKSSGDGFASSLEMVREPGGVMTEHGWRAGVWTVGRNGQTEINHLWPPEAPANVDVLWLTDYTGITEATLTGFTPEPSDAFTVWDEIVLETRDQGEGRFALHADCKTANGDIGAALLSFETGRPVPLMGWTIDYDSMTFVLVHDPSTIRVGDCYEAEPRR